MHDIYLDDEHIDDPDVLDVGVDLELFPELLSAAFDVHRKFVPVDHGGDVAPPGLVQRTNSESGLGVVQRQERLHLENDYLIEKHFKIDFS